MQQLRLFDTDQQFGAIKLDSRIHLPLLWIERLILLSEPTATKQIRVIHFQPGLNIIRTEHRSPEERKCIAHDVGKTLLVRLIRYTLGDPWFGDRRTMERIRTVYPYGMAIAQWHLADAQWTIVRPLDETWQSAYVIRGFDWANSLDATTERIPLDVFLREINAHLQNSLPQLPLSKGQSGSFEHILPWLTRDTQFGFQKPDSWRDKDVNPSDQTSPLVNRLIMKWLMGLMSPLEAKFRNARLELRDASKIAAGEHVSNVALVNSLYEQLREASQFHEPPQESGSDPHSIDAKASLLIAFVRAEKNNAITTYASGSIENRRQLDDAETRQKKLQEEKESAIRQEERAKAILDGWVNQLSSESIAPPAHCPGGSQCFMRIGQQGGATQNESKHLGRLKAEKDDANSDYQSARSLLKDISQHLGAVDREISDLRERIQNLQNQGQAEQSRWNSLAILADSLETALTRSEQSQHKIVMLEDDAKWHDQEIEKQETSESTKSKQNRLEHCYSHILSRIMDDIVDGRLDSTNGLRPSEGKDSIRHGTAITTMENVLAYDLASVLGSMCGIGSHPRLLIHDGPREGEAESELFKNLLSTAEWMEKLCDGDVSFQYILTTADAPEPYTAEHAKVAEVLHGRDDDGRLLKRKF